MLAKSDSIPDELKPLARRAADMLGEDVISIRRISGGCIAGASRVQTKRAVWFLKSGTGEVARTLDAESDGLKTLYAAPCSLRIPMVRASVHEEDGQPALLISEWIEHQMPNDQTWDALGVGLADMHRFEGRQVGYHRANYIGRLVQQNETLPDWPTFFRERRLAPQVAIARKTGAWSAEWNEGIDWLLNHLEKMLPKHPNTSLLHGDLWSGNFLATSDAEAALIDPAVYFGDRETDLAMTELFGGFGARFYDSYNDVWPLDSGYRERKYIYNLYHAVNHLNHFGSGYTGMVAALLQRFK